MNPAAMPTRQSRMAKALSGRGVLRVATIVATCLITSCGSTPGRPHSAASLRAPALTITQQATVVRSGAKVGRLSAWNHYLTWSEGDQHSVGGSRVIVDDVDSGEVTTVVDVSATGHDIDPVVGTEVGGGADYVIYTELSNPIGDQKPNASWRLWALKLGTRQPQLVAQDLTPSPGLAAPYPRAQGMWVVWSELSPATSDWNVRSLDLKTWTIRTLATNTGAQSPSVYNGLVYYDGRDPGSRAVDLYEVPADGSRPSKQLTHTGNIALPRAGDGLVVWQEPATGQAQSEWVESSADDSAPVLLASDEGGNVVPGHGFVLWYSLLSDALMATPVTGRQLGVPQKVNGAGLLNLGPRWSASGSLVAWATLDGPGTTTIHIADVALV